MQNRIPLTVVAATIAASISMPAQADIQPPPTISVTGEATISAPPDLAQIEAGVTTDAKTAREASGANNDAMGKVLLALKSAGIGAALMREAIAEASRLGHGAVMLVGDAAYYQRFGFSAARTDALSMPGPYEKNRLLALELVAGALDGASGVLRPAGRKAYSVRIAKAV